MFLRFPSNQAPQRQEDGAASELVVSFCDTRGRDTQRRNFLTLIFSFMLGLGAAFGGGVYFRQQLDKVKLPTIRRRQWDAHDTFKFTVHVVSASAPGLGEPGLVSRLRPRLEVSLASVHKTTELGDFTPNDGGLFNECPWRFGDTLTFTARLSDVLGPGLTLRLRAEKDFHLGPLQLDFSRLQRWTSWAST